VRGTNRSIPSARSRRWQPLGLSNRQIGERLFLSHRTIGSHLYRIFPKLEITSRAQLRDALADRTE
jgi:DNA-binding NarL/FixJ family response regulator